MYDTPAAPSYTHNIMPAISIITANIAQSVTATFLNTSTYLFCFFNFTETLVNHKNISLILYRPTDIYLNNIIIPILCQ